MMFYDNESVQIIPQAIVQVLLFNIQQKGFVCFSQLVMQNNKNVYLKVES